MMTLLRDDAAIDSPNAAKGLDESRILDESRSTAATEVSDDDDSSRRGNLYFQQPRSGSPPLITCEEDSDDIQENLAAHASDETDFPSKRGLGQVARDSLLVLPDKVNDGEEHEANPCLKDYLVPQHEHHENDADEAAGPPPPTAKEARPILQRDGSPEVAVEVAEEVVANPSKQKRNVSFGSICVRDYGMVLGDHPCTGYGPPVMLDWDYSEYAPLTVNDYELHRGNRRSLKEMGMNYYYRMDLLQKGGFSDAEIKQAMKAQSKEKMNRAITKAVISYQVNKVEDAVESGLRKLRRLSGSKDHWKCKEQKESIARLSREDSVRQMMMMSGSCRSLSSRSLST